jgi:hypothetical protein
MATSHPDTTARPPTTIGCVEPVNREMSRRHQVSGEGCTRWPVSASITLDRGTQHRTGAVSGEHPVARWAATRTSFWDTATQVR